MSRQAWAYIWGVLLGGTVLAALAWPGVMQTQAHELTFVTLTVLATLAQLFKAEAPNHVLFYATPVFFVAGMLLLHPFLFVLLVAVPHIVEWIRERAVGSAYLRAWYLQPFNIAMYTIAGLTAHAACSALPVSAPKAELVMLSSAITVTIAAVTYVAVNHIILGLVLVLARGVSFRQSGVLDSESLLTDAILAALGCVVAALWVVNPWLIPLALSPLVLMYRALLIPKLKQEAQTDAKTGLCNTAHFTTLFAAELDRAARFERPLALIMADLDRFKTINDTYGHLAGDIVLAGVGQLIRATVRDYDIAGRFGGEEFAIVLPEVEPGEAQAFAERLRQAIAAARFDIPSSSIPLQVTMSLGVACFPAQGNTMTLLTASADSAVYQAKASGRNRVVCAFEGAIPAQGSGAPAYPTSPLLISAPEPSHNPPSVTLLRGEAPLTGGNDGGSSEQWSGAGMDVSPPAHDGAPRKAGDDGRGAPKAPLWLFVGGVIATGVGVTLLGLALEAAPQLPFVALLTILAILTEWLQVDLYGRGTVSVSLGLTFGAALVTGIPGLACISAAIALAHHLRQGRRVTHVHQAAFNWATHILAGLAPVLAVHIQGLSIQVRDLIPLAIPTATAALAYYAIETGLVATAVSLSEGAQPLATWRAQYRWLAGHYLVLCLMGLVASMAYTGLGLLGVLVFTLPVVMMHVVQKQYIVRTRESMRELTRLNQELTRAARTDRLTGLGNGHAFQDDVHRAIARAVRDTETLTLARIDVDEFKVINEQQGYMRGDSILSALADILRASRASDSAFRLNSDEFALILAHTNLADATMVMERVRQEAEDRLGGVTVSIGVAALAPGERDADLLNEQAEAALSEAKRRRRNAVVTFDQVQDSVSVTSWAQAQAIRRLLSERHVTVAFQPIWDLHGGRILAVEALIRPAASYGLAGPQEAFDIAERIGRAHDLDAVCRQAILARAAELPAGALLFINVSPQTLDHDLLAGTRLVDAVTAAGLTPDRVVLEITERSVARLAVVIREARRLRRLGFRLALDDTGAGNAGLEMLSQLPVDFIKIDRAVVANALTDSTARAVLAALVAFAREADSFVIAEGIETTAMLDLVRQAGAFDSSPQSGVQGVQGYLLGRPSEAMPAVVAVPLALSA